MKRMSALFLAAGMAVTAAPAFAQYHAQLQPHPDSRVRSSYPSTPQYDYARVLRVDPVFESGRGYGAVNDATRCREQPTYVHGDAYDTYGRGGYGRDRYARDGYMRDGYGRDGYARDGYARDGYARDGYYGRGNRDPYGYSDQRAGTQTGATVATVVGGLVGAVLGSQVGGGSGRYATSAIGSMVGGMAGREIYEQTQRNRTRTGTVRVCDPVPVDGRYRATGGSAVRAYDVTYEYGGRQYTTRTDHHPGDRIRVRVDVRPD